MENAWSYDILAMEDKGLIRSERKVLLLSMPVRYWVLSDQMIKSSGALKIRRSRVLNRLVAGSVWNSAIMHAIWNIIIVGGILHIGSAADKISIYNYVLKTDSLLITGGDFGIEASVVAVAAYLIFTVLAVRLMKNN